MDQQRTIEFILEQQAKFFAGIEASRQQIEESRQQIEESRQQIEESRQQMTDFRHQVSLFIEQQGQINISFGKAMLGLTEHVEKLIVAQTNTDERINALITAQSHSDERLNALIGVVDGVIRRPPAPPQ